MTWRSGLAITGFVVSLAGVLVSALVFRLFVLLILGFDYGVTPVELFGIPLSIVGLALCACGPRNGAVARLSRLGLLLAVAGLLVAGLVGIAILNFSGGSV